MQYLIYVLAFIPFAICAPGSTLGAPQGALSFTCTNQQGRAVNIPLADTKVSLKVACDLSRNRAAQLSDFPKTFTPAFGQQLAATSKTGKYFVNPVNRQKYPNAYIIASDDCALAGVMMDRTGGLLGSPAGAQPVVSRPANSVRTRPGSPVAQSVRTRPAAAIGARSESNTGKTEHTSNLEKRVVKGSALQPCKMSTYNWNADVSGTGRQLGRVPVPGSRAPF